MNQIAYIEKNAHRYTEGYLDQVDEQGNTALYYAVESMHEDVVDLLIQLGADVNRKCQHGNTALHYAMMVGEQIEKNNRIISILI